MLQSFYIRNSFFIVAAIAATLYFISYFVPVLYQLANIILLLLLLAVALDTLLLYSKKGITAQRKVANRLSMGDDNKIELVVKNNYGFKTGMTIIDEIPVQFQVRDWNVKLQLQAGEEKSHAYLLKPLSRGEYVFNNINLFANGVLGLVQRRYVFKEQQVTKVYPSYMQMRKYQLLGVSNKLQEAGVRRMRRLGHSMEFEQIKEYVPGDDYRTINWKATGRKGDLMVNNFTDERSQQVYCVINKGRVMKMPFEGLTLLDYAINASLVLSSTALARQDRAGLITFAETLDAFVLADKKTTQMNLVLETLYKQETRFLEADFEKLYATIRHRITNRSLLVLFTNFESVESLQREMPALKKMAHYHLLVVVFFENTELRKVIDNKADNMEDIYIKTIAEKFSFEKKLMVKELQQNGILSILTTPQNLTINTLNKYIDLKTRGAI
ncbi:DUF58 domain-containing protein [Terrimonas rubra]|uniref:DUF58 domain-containing protein n=1 Tax=Terrimonas rubra TaxID=1035890 RepID=A0ABW6A583_9BACT